MFYSDSYSVKFKIYCYSVVEFFIFINTLYRKKSKLRMD